VTTYDLGDTVPLSVDVTTSAGVLVNCATMVLTVTLPDGTTATPSLTNTPTGSYYVDWVPPTTMRGDYVAEFRGTAPTVAYIEEFSVGTGLITLTELASHLQQDLDTYTAQLALDGARGIIEGRIGRPVMRVTRTPRLPVQANDRQPRAYGDDYCFGGYVTLPGGPVTAVTSVQADDVALSTDEWAWDRFDTVYVATDEPTVEVTMTAGYNTVPADLKAVALALAGRIYAQPVAAVRSESIDDYSVAYDTSGATAQDLSPLEAMVLDRYRTRVAMIGMR
jgi:hypothetical protein